MKYFLLLVVAFQLLILLIFLHIRDLIGSLNDKNDEYGEFVFN